MNCKKCGNPLEAGDRFCDVCGTPVVPDSVPADSIPAAFDTDIQIPDTVQTDYNQANAFPVSEGIDRNDTLFSQNSAFQGDINGKSTAGTHPYHKLGGILLFIQVMFNYIAPVCIFLTGVSLIVAVVKLFSIDYVSYYLNDRLTGTVITVLVITELILIILNSFIISFGRKIKNRDPRFLRSFQKYMIYGTVFYLISILSTHFIAYKLLGYLYYYVRDYISDKSMLSNLITFLIVTIIWNIYFVKSVRVRTYMGSDEYLRKSIFNRRTQSPVPADGIITPAPDYNNSDTAGQYVQSSPLDNFFLTVESLDMLISPPREPELPDVTVEFSRSGIYEPEFDIVTEEPEENALEIPDFSPSVTAEPAEKPPYGTFALGQSGTCEICLQPSEMLYRFTINKDNKSSSKNVCEECQEKLIEFISSHKN